MTPRRNHIFLIPNLLLPGGTAMLRWALLFFVIALIAGALGAFRTEILAANIAWVLFVVFIILALVSLVMGRRSGPPV
jgi:uncharacterized membrane protein YtjA (UPF0391 family)